MDEIVPVPTSLHSFDERGFELTEELATLSWDGFSASRSSTRSSAIPRRGERASSAATARDAAP